MTLLLTIIAAVIATAIWYRAAAAQGDKMLVSTLCWLYWGASIMWLVDAIAEYIELGEEYFSPTLAELVSDAFLGLSVIALGLVIWLAVLLIKDPCGAVRRVLLKK